MGHRTATGWLPFTLLVLLACGGGREGERGEALDAGREVRDGAPPGSSVDGGELDGGSTSADGGTRSGSDDGGSPGDGSDGGPACLVTSEGDAIDASCDLLELALFDDGSGEMHVRLHGRVDPGAGCAVVDAVDIQYEGSTIGMLEGAGLFEAGSPNAVLAEGEALPEMESRCAGDDQRFGGFGLVVKGGSDAGPFEARCADAERGSRWPPALRVTCHENVDARPSTGYASVGGGPITTTSIDITVPHGPGGALTSVNGTARVIPGAAAFGGGVVPDPYDITGLDGHVAEGSSPVFGAYTSLTLLATEDVFGPELCSTPPSDPSEPMVDTPPVMLLRVTGDSERGSYRTEAYLDMCTRM